MPLRITDAHVRFWYRHQTAPRWVRDFEGSAKYRPIPDGVGAGIHQLINSQTANDRPSFGHHAGNTWRLVRMITRRGVSLRDALAQLVESGNVPADPRRRARCIRALTRLGVTQIPGWDWSGRDVRELTRVTITGRAEGGDDAE